MKKKNIILISIVFFVVVICILAAVIGFGLSDEPKENDRGSVNLSQNKETTKDKESDEKTKGETKDKESDEKPKDETEETTEKVTEKETVEEESTSREEASKETTKDLGEEVTEEETATKQEDSQEETTTSVQKEELGRLSYEYMIIDGKSVYTEYNSKIMELYEFINAERISAGMSALTFDSDISYIACARASQIAYENVFEGSSEVKYYDLMGKSGIVFSKAVENTAAGYDNAKEVVSGNGTSWKTSEKHYDNMISDKYTRVGVGVDYSETMGYVWVAIFSN